MKLDNTNREILRDQMLKHHGVKGMKWGKRKAKPDGDIRVGKGSDIHRIIPKEWLEREKSLSGHAYATFKKEDTERYKHFAKLFGGGENYVDMNFKTKDILISPSKQKRVDEFIKLMNNNPDAKSALIKATRNPISFMPKKTLDNLDNSKKAEKAFNKFSYLLVTKKNLRNPYFEQLKKQGYNMIIDDADIKSGISKSPIIVFDRDKTLKFEKGNTLTD